jgi:hypothetical protein
MDFGERIVTGLTSGNLVWGQHRLVNGGGVNDLIRTLDVIRQAGTHEVDR